MEKGWRQACEHSHSLVEIVNEMYMMMMKVMNDQQQDQEGDDQQQDQEGDDQEKMTIELMMTPLMEISSLL